MPSRYYCRCIIRCIGCLCVLPPPPRRKGHIMKIKYTFANGDVTEIEVSEEIGAVVLDLDRQEYNTNHRETRRHCSLEALDLDGNLLPSKDNVEMDFIRKEDGAKLRDVISRLNPRQQKLIKAIYAGCSGRCAHRGFATCGFCCSARCQRCMDLPQVEKRYCGNLATLL